MKYLMNRYTAAFLISPLLIALAVFFFVQNRANTEMLDTKFRAVQQCKGNYSTDKDSYSIYPADTKVTYSDLATLVVNGSDVKVTGTVIYETAKGTIKRVEMECIVAGN